MDYSSSYGLIITWMINNGLYGLFIITWTCNNMDDQQWIIWIKNSNMVYQFNTYGMTNEFTKS